MKFIIELDLDKIECPVGHFKDHKDDHARGLNCVPKNITVAMILRQIAQSINDGHDNAIPDDTIEMHNGIIGRYFKQ